MKHSLDRQNSALLFWKRWEKAVLGTFPLCNTKEARSTRTVNLASGLKAMYAMGIGLTAQQELKYMMAAYISS
jgi:hypothetical protein